MLTVTRRDDKVFTFYFYDENGDAINLTGCALYTTVKQNIDDTDANAKISSTLSITVPATGGIATWTLVPADTQYLMGQYYWDVQLKDASNKITTLIRDIFEVVADVTIRTTV
jgi:hypothetical protein